MQITVDIEERRVADLVRGRIAELLSDDARYRGTPVRDLLRRMVDDAATTAVRAARDAIAAELPAMAAEAVRAAIKNEIDRAAKRGMGALRKLFAGFDPSKLTPEQRSWLEKQIAEGADKREDGA